MHKGFAVHTAFLTKAGTARLLAHLGFEALATTSMGYAFSAGKRDNTVDRHEILERLRTLAAATDRRRFRRRLSRVRGAAGHEALVIEPSLLDVRDFKSFDVPVLDPFSG